MGLLLNISFSVLEYIFEIECVKIMFLYLKLNEEFRINWLLLVLTEIFNELMKFTLFYF
jgi:hypothetical protein